MIWGFLQPPLDRICEEWVDDLLSDHDWERHDDQPQSGEAQGFRVESEIKSDLLCT